MEFSEFLRIFEVRAPNLMWFLGAGCSVSSGAPSAADIIWDCKSRIYCSENGVARSRVADISSPQIQKIIEEYLLSKGIVPQPDDDGDEYTYYFEKAMASKSDRQSYIRDLISTTVPSYGHFILASLSKISKAPIIWTTNFDKLIESAVHQVNGNVNNLVVADLGEPEKAIHALDNKTFPLLVKLHGDFHSERLKNTQLELQKQDEKMRSALSKASAGYGLCVVGYSGRDKSIIETLEASIRAGGFPHGIFWFTRSGSKPLQAVVDLIALAKTKNIEAHLIEINNFDETLDGIRRYMDAFPREIEDFLKPKASRKTDAMIAPVSKKPPFLRLNALQIDATPTMCKIVNCDIGGYKEVQSAILDTQANIIAYRVRKGVIAFGSDQEIRKAFRGYGIKSLEIYPINPDKLAVGSGEYNLIYDGLCKAIERHTGLKVEHRRGQKYLIANDSIPVKVFNELTPDSVTSISGVVPSTSIRWRQSCKIDIDYKFNKLWLLLSPRVLLSFPESGSTESEKNKAKAFVKEMTAPRFQSSTGRSIGYNSIAASILSGWMSILAEKTNTPSLVISSLGLNDGLDPQFEIRLDKVISGRS